MSALHASTGSYKRHALAVLAGLMLAAAFPKMSVAVLAWVGPGLLLAVALGQPRAQAFRLGFVGGLVFHLVLLYWLLFIPVRFAPVVGWLVLSAYLALYQGAWVWMCCESYRVLSGSAGTGSFWEEFVQGRSPRQLLWAMSCAASWVALEMVQARLFSGFPWNFLGVSQYTLTPLIQIASATGVYGVSFLVAWFSVSGISALALVVLRPARPRDWMLEMAPPLCAVLLVAAFGMREVFYAQRNPPTLKITLVQPSIPQQVIWDPGHAAERFGALLQLSKQAVTNRPDLLVWPEAAVPNLFRYDTNIHIAVTNLAREHGTWLVLGADDVVWNDEEPGKTDYRYYNSSFLVTPDGHVERSYRKRRLVIFGEYVPLARWLPFLRDFTSVQGDFTPGRYPVTFVLSNLNVRASPLICFEDTFPHVVRDHVWEDTDFLLNLTNNGWFGESAAQWQHAANALFRAIEHRIPIVRCANNGLSCWVDEVGRLHSVYFPGTKDIYGPGSKTVRVPIRSGQARERTLYGRHGDWFGWGCVAWTVCGLLWRVTQRGWS